MTTARDLLSFLCNDTHVTSSAGRYAPFYARHLQHLLPKHAREDFYRNVRTDIAKLFQSHFKTALTVQAEMYGTHVYDNLNDHVIFFITSYLPTFQNIALQTCYYVAKHAYATDFAKYELLHALRRCGIAVEWHSRKDTQPLIKLLLWYVWLRSGKPPIVQYLEQKKVLTRRSKQSTINSYIALFNSMNRLLMVATGGQGYVYVQYTHRIGFTTPGEQDCVEVIENLITEYQDDG